MCISFLFVRFVLVSPQYHHHQDTFFCLLYLYIGYKIDPYGDKNIGGGDNVFYDGLKTSDLGSRAHILKNLHGKMIFGPFEKKSMKVLFGEDIDP